MLNNYLRTAFRSLFNNKLYSIINIISLTIGFTCFILIFLWVEDEYGVGRGKAKGKDVYQLTITHENGILDPNVPYFLPYAMAEIYPEIINYTRIRRIGNVTNCVFAYQEGDGEPLMFYERNVIMVDTGFFSIFPFPFISGDPKSALLDRNGVVLRREVAEKYFGDADPMGRVLLFNNQLSLRVTGVVDVPSRSVQQPDFILPLRSNMADNYNWRDPSYILLHSATAVNPFKDKISGAMMELYKAPLPGELILGILPLSKSYLSFGKMKYIYILSVVAIFILLVGCINYIILTIGRSTKRIKEIGVRKITGGQKGQLIVQLLFESVLVTIIAMFLSLIVIEFTLPAFGRFAEKNLSIGYFSRPQIILIFMLVAIFVGILAGFYPALSFTRNSPIATLQTSHIVGSKKSLFMTIAVIIQFSISFLLLTSTLLIMNQLSYMMNRPLGLNIENIVEIPMNSSLGQRFESYKARLSRNPNILKITAGQSEPFNEDYKTGLSWEGKDPDLVPVIRYSITLPDYIETFEIEIVEGRSFTNDFTTDISNYVINEKAIQLLGVDDPIGMRVEFWGMEGEIIGVCKDFHHVSLHREILPHIFTINPLTYRNLNYIFIKLSGENIQETLEEIETVTKEFAPQYPFKYNFLDSSVGKLYASDRRLGTIIMMFAFISLFITCLGIFSLTTFMAERRTKEFGIRKVNGARAINLLRLINGDIFTWILISIVITTPLAYIVMHRWLQNFAFRVSIGFWIFFLTAIIILFIALSTSTGVTVKSAFKNPVDSLRYE